MPLNLFFQGGLGRIGIEIQTDIQGIEFEPVAMRSCGWTGTSVTVFLEIILSLHRFLRDRVFLDHFRSGWDVPQYPVNITSPRGIFIVEDQCKRLRSLGNMVNPERRIDILSGTSILQRYLPVVLKGGGSKSSGLQFLISPEPSPRRKERPQQLPNKTSDTTSFYASSVEGIENCREQRQNKSGKKFQCHRA